MDANLDKIAKDLYGKIQTRFPNIKIGDENAAVLSKKDDIPKARFFEFEYTEDGEPLGTIAITLDADDGIVVQVSGDLVNDDDDTTHHNAYKFIRSFRQFAKDRLLNFDVQNIGKSNMDKRDYEFQAKRKEEPVMPQEPVMESKMYGNARMSYQDLGEARLVVKHSQPVNLDVAAGRTMHIDSIYIENAQGERFRYPFKHLNGARALAEHIKHGGNPYDAIGKHITSLSEELASLRKFKGYVSRQEQVSEAMGNVTGRVIDRIEQIKETIHKLQRTAYYESFVESFEEQEEQMIPEEIQNDLIDRLTIRTFNEELKSVFPYIYKFVNEDELEVVELGAEDILSELSKDTLKAYGNAVVHDIVDHLAAGTDSKDRKFSNRIKGAQRGYEKEQEKERAERKVKNPEDQFESFMNNIIREDKDEIFSPNKDAQNAAIEKLNQILSKELKGGPEGVNAIESLRGLIDDPEFLNSLRDIDPDLDVRPLVQQFILQRDPDIATRLHFDGGAPEAMTPPAPAPAAPTTPAPAPAPAAPTTPDMSAAAPAAGTDVTAAAPAPALAESSNVDFDKVLEAIAALYGPEIWDNDAMQDLANDLEQANPTEKELNFIIAKGRLPKRLANTLFTNNDDVQFGEGPSEDPPFDPDPPKKNPIAKAGKHGLGHSTAKHLAHQGMAKAIKKAKDAGATLDTKMDLGSREITLHDAIKESGMSPEDFGFEGETIDGLHEMMKFISGFYNKENGTFPLGAERIKIKLKKQFEDGAFGEVNPEELTRVMKFIDMKDPGSAHNQHIDIIRLAGVPNHNIEVDEAGADPRLDQLNALIAKLQGPHSSNTNSFSSTGTINNKPVSYDDAMAKFNDMANSSGDLGTKFNDMAKNMKLKFGDQELDLNNPDQMGSQIQKMLGGAMNNMQSQVPNQNVQFPGGQMNPAELMKSILSKLPKN